MPDGRWTTGDGARHELVKRLMALAAGALLLAGCTTTPTTLPPDATLTPPTATTPTPSGSTESGVQAQVVRVVDGDTLDVQTGAERVRVRLLAVDTPEKFETAECFGKEATEHASVLLPVGAPVRLEADPGQGDKDRYGRALRYVTIAGTSTDVGLELIRGGYAAAYRLRYGPAPVRHAAYVEAQVAAQGARVGMWSACPTNRTATT